MQSIPSYFAFIIFITLFILRLLVKPILIRKSEFQKIDLLPLIFLLIWFYGFTIGVIKGNNIEFIIRNFAGMVLYTSYFIFIVQKPKINRIIKYLIIISIFYTFDSFYSFYNSFSGGSLIFSFLGSTRYYFSIGTLLIFPLISYLLTKILFPHKNLNISMKSKLFNSFINSKVSSLFLLLLCILAGVVFPFSKGNLLAFIFILLSLLFSQIVAKNVSSINKLFFSTLSLISGLLIILYLINNSISMNLFSQSQEGNKTRYEQINLLSSDINFMGHGLGAEIKGYARDQKNKYGFETTYLNLIHKFGFMSLPLFICYLISLLIPLQNIIKNEKLLENSLAFGMMGFLFPSIGNPMLFSPVSCLLHCTSNYLIRNKKSKNNV
ncbi:MAG: hypothetical protein CMF54_07770 [Legionellales bacterium]|nr:hypothetical protein [Legionellales bacterium]|tara:strand:- start:2693 stop:3832 length:1140 start_codon:yes stop_codon:yes gene_type:complete